MNMKLRKHLRQMSRSEWFDLYHIHPSLYGYRQRDLGLLCRIEGVIRSLLSRSFEEYQCFIAIDLSNSDYDAVFAHTPNGNKGPFPAPLEPGRITRRRQAYSSVMIPLERRGYTCFKSKGRPSIIAIYAGSAPTRESGRRCGSRQASQRGRRSA